MYLYERLRLSPLRLSSVLMYILTNCCDTPELVALEDYAMVVTGSHGNLPLEQPLNSKPGRTSHPVPVPAIVVWNPEVFDKGKNMWTSCRIRVTSCLNATASQPSIVHVGCSQPIRVYSLRCWASRERFFPVISRDATATKVYTHIVVGIFNMNASCQFQLVFETKLRTSRCSGFVQLEPFFDISEGHRRK
ncbi:hypothetical protein EDD15DRAFT_2475495 [Pisolithus albus]|nr:hypothetical protein EDD15DRAFT_2475495 [Pisolithus albus]